MTSEQKLDLLERLARSLCERPLYPRRESRKQADALGDYLNALTEFDAASQAFAQKLDDPDTNERLKQARESLDHAREELKRLSKNRSGRLPL
jgi:aminoglycoside phosphotransferase (APT) family kinase protein